MSPKSVFAIVLGMKKQSAILVGHRSELYANIHEHRWVWLHIAPRIQLAVISLILTASAGNYMNIYIFVFYIAWALG